MAEKVNSLPGYKRLFYRDTPVYVAGDKPDWFIPAVRADGILKKLLDGASVERAAAEDSQTFGGGIERSIFLIEGLMERLDKRAAVSYSGRAEFLSLSKLKECWFHVTNNCNLACRHCMFSSAPGRPETLARDELTRAIEEARGLGCGIFYFTGGEPLVYEGFTDICDSILGYDDSHIVILSNGILIRKLKRWLDKADKSRLHFQISLDGLEAHHDGIRGEGAFSRTMEGVRLLRDMRCNVTFAMAVTADDALDMAAMVEFAAAEVIGNVHFLWLFRKGKEEGNGFAPVGVICENLSEARRVADAGGVLIDNVEIVKSQVFSLPGTKYDLSNSCWQSLAVGPDGNIYPSPALIGEEAVRAGHISEGIERVWRDSEVCRTVRKASLVDCEEYRGNPLKFLVGGGDIDHSFVNSGRFVGGDPYIEVYNSIALQLLAEQVDMKARAGHIGILSRMGERLYECGDDMGEVVCTHSNCVLSLPGKDGHTLVRNFYSAAAATSNEEIFNPVHYDEAEISHIPEEARVRSYGCGSPLADAEVESGAVVADFGCGTGVECFIAAKNVGAKGRVYGIDMADAMLDIAVRAREQVSGKLGYENVEFRKAFLEDTSLEKDSVDVVISNCVINLSPDKRRTFAEIFRVLKPGGRLVISDIAYDDDIPLDVKYNQRLRGECIGGAFKQGELFGLLSDVGFEDARILRRFLYRVVAGHNFYSVTYRARKAPAAKGERVIYPGPFAAVVTDDGQVLRRGQKMSVKGAGDAAKLEHVLVLDEQGNITNVEQQNTCCHFAAPAAAQTQSRSMHPNGCMVCGAELVYSQENRKAECHYCGGESLTNVLCAEGHFVCDACHQEDAISVIKRVCLHSDERDMSALMRQIRSTPGFPMHGPEHHSMVPAVILTVYRNITGRLRDEQILTAIERGETLAGGACAFLGVCGAASGAGIALSIVLEADPYKSQERQDVQRFTAEILRAVARYRAARCCQRDCWTALKEVSNLSEEYFGVYLPAEEDIECGQHKKNRECIGAECPLWPDVAQMGGGQQRDVDARARPGISVVIPVLNEYDQINDTIEELRKKDEGTECEIIVVDGDGGGSTIKAIRDSEVRTTISQKGRGRQMNAGAAIAKGDIIIFLHADTVLPDGATGKIRRTLENEKYVGGAFDLGIDSERALLKWIAAKASLRSRLNRIPYGDQAIFLRRRYFQDIGGFEEIPVMEDVELMRRVKRRRDKICILRDKVRTSARRWETEGALYTTIRNRILVGLYYLGVSPERLSRFYGICSNGKVKKGR